MAVDMKELKALVSHLEGLREKRLAQQLEIGKLILPSRGLFKGEETECLRDANLFNPAAQRALRKAAAGMTQAITPASDPWFRHAFLSRDDREVTYANEYVDSVDSRIRSVLSAGGFYQGIHAFNKELLGFGCALFYCESSRQTCGTYAVALDADRMLSCVVRRLRMTPTEMKERFGEDKLSSVTRELLKTKPYGPVEVVHVVRKREDGDVRKKDARNMPFASYWYEENGEGLLTESGFHSMPFFSRHGKMHEAFTEPGPGTMRWPIRKALKRGNGARP